MTTETKVIGTRTIEGYDEPVRIYWTRSVEGRDEDGQRVTMIYNVEDCPDFDAEYPDGCEPYTVALRTYREGLDDLDGEPWDIDSEGYETLSDVIARAEEWAAAEESDQVEREESHRENLAGSLEDMAGEAWDDSDEKAAIAALAALLKQGKATEALAALKAAGLA